MKPLLQKQIEGASKRINLNEYVGPDFIIPVRTGKPRTTMNELREMVDDPEHKNGWDLLALDAIKKAGMK